MYKLFSVDDHIIEPADLWSSRVPAKYRDVAPHVVEEDGREIWVYENERVLTMGLNAVAGKPQDQWNLDPVRYSDMIPGCYDPAERAKDMLSQGVLASVNFPTLPRFGGLLFASFADKALAHECVVAWNDFIFDEWCPGGPPGMFVPMVITDVWDPQLAAKELERCIERGARALAFPENPAPEGLPTLHGPEWDPLWAVAEEAGIAVCMHIASSGFVPIADPAAPISSAFSAGNVNGILSMVNLLYSGVCSRFPGLKVVWSEGGIGWVPAVLERCDRSSKRQTNWDGQRELPSEVYARNMWSCMVDEPIGLKLWELIGEDKILSETDYPHSDTTFPDTQDVYAEIFDGIPETVVRKVSHENACRVFDWEMADSSLITAGTPWSMPIDYEPRWAGTLTSSDATGSKSGKCRVQVLKGALYEDCGRELGADGVCPAEHERITGRGNDRLLRGSSASAASE